LSTYLDPVRLPLKIAIHPAQIPAKLTRISKREELDPVFMLKHLKLLSGPEPELLGHGPGDHDLTLRRDDNAFHSSLAGS